MMLGTAVSRLPQHCGLLKSICPAVATVAVRHGHRLRGKPPGVAKTIEQRMKWEAEKTKKFVEEKKLVDIGFPAQRRSRSDETKLRGEHRQKIKTDLEIERKSRNLELIVDAEQVKKDWFENEGQFQIHKIAQHYGIYQHLFGYAFFLPRVKMDIKYAISDEEYATVHYGNVLKPTEAKNQPEVTFDAKIKLTNENNSDSLWTLVLTNPDGHFDLKNKEYVHWFVGNIPNGDVSKGETIVPYLQPFPALGTGYHRHIFVLYKQEKKIDFNAYKVEKLNDLAKRTFTTYDFYRKHQDAMTPAGLAFFQSDWDSNLTDFYHNVLDMQEPVFEYDFPAPYRPPERYFPLKQAFNLYLDRYRDPKQINKEFLVRELRKTDPFKGPEPAKRYPAAHSLKNIPSWLINEKKKSRLGQGRINELREEYR